MSSKHRDIDDLLKQLFSPNSHNRDSAAEALSDWLEYGELTCDERIRLGNHLLEALSVETDETVMEAILNALGSVNLRMQGGGYRHCPTPQVDWNKLARCLPKLRENLLGEYALTTLGESGDVQMAEHITPYLQHSSTEIRVFARTALEMLVGRES